jgi:hypothetical protein
MGFLYLPNLHQVVGIFVLEKDILVIKTSEFLSS